MIEVALFYGLSSQRLRARCVWAGCALALALFLPYEVIDGKAQFVWHLLPELPPAGVVAAIAPTIAGIAVAIAPRVIRRASSLALAVPAALALTAALIRFGADAAAWEVLPLPESLTDRPASSLLALALTAAGANLSFRPRARRASRFVLGAAIACAALFYLWPARGEAPIATLLRSLAALPDLPGWRFRLGALILAALALWPLAVPALGLVHAFRPAAREQPVLGVVALFGLPVLLLMMVYRSLLGAQGGAGVMAALLSVVILAALLALVASSAEVLGEALVTPEDELEQAPGWPIRRAAAVAFGAAAVIAAAQWVLARPPRKGVAWSLSAPTKDGDHLYGELLPAWSDARLRWDRRVRQGGSAEAMVEVKGAARELASAARGVEPGVGAAFEALTREAGDLDLGGRRWYRLIGDVNEASRGAGLPYYVDPSVDIYQTDDGLRRHFFANSYRIERVRRFAAGRADLAALHVRRLGRARDGHLRLGFSRDLQPFALIVLDELEPYAEEMTKLGAANPPSCSERGAAAAGGDAGAEEALARCGEALGRALAAAPGGLLPALTLSTERHEIQHQLDGPHLAMASLVLRRMAGYADDAQRRVNRELSAYVAELTTEGASPRLGLIHLARFALLSRGGAEHHVALIAFEALTGRDVRDGRGRVDRGAVGAAFGELAAEDDGALRNRAARAWGELFGGGLAELEEATQ